MRNKILAVATAVIMTSMVGCSDVEDDSVSDKETMDHTQNAVVKHVKAFYEDMDKPENVVASPLSADCSMLMLANGSEGETKDEIEGYLGGSADELNDNFVAYAGNLMLGNFVEMGTRTHMANSLWYDNGLIIKDDYVKKVQGKFNAQVNSLTENAMSEINSWVSKQTDGKIPEITGPLADDMSVVLMNALYFSSNWTNAFSVDDATTIFTASDGTTQELHMLSDRQMGGYMETDNATAFAKGYEGDYMFIGILPQSNDVKFADIDIKSLLNSIQNSVDDETYVKMPKFSFDYSVSLYDTIRSMGVEKVFTSNAELSKMLEGSKHHVSDINHKAMIELDEKGVIAAVEIGEEDTSVSDKNTTSHKIVLDRPFYFIVMDTYENMILIGHVEKPF